MRRWGRASFLVIRNRDRRAETGRTNTEWVRCLSPHPGFPLESGEYFPSLLYSCLRLTVSAQRNPTGTPENTSTLRAHLNEADRWSPRFPAVYECPRHRLPFSFRIQQIAGGVPTIRVGTFLQAQRTHRTCPHLISDEKFCHGHPIRWLYVTTKTGPLRMRVQFLEIRSHYSTRRRYTRTKNNLAKEMYTIKERT